MTTVGQGLAAAVTVALLGCSGAAPSAPATVAPSVAIASSAPSASAAPSATTMALTFSTTAAPSAPLGALTVQAGPGPIFRPSTLDAPTGDFQIFITSPAVAPDVATQGHNIGIRGQDTLDIIARSDYLKAGDDPLVFSVSGLAPGKYVFVCEYPGHVEDGMRGTLTIGP